MNLTNLNKQKDTGRYSFPMKLMATLVLMFSLFQSARAQAPFSLATGAPTNISASEVQFDIILTAVNVVNTYEFNSIVMRGTIGTPGSSQTSLATPGGTVSWGLLPNNAAAGWPVNVNPWPYNVVPNFGYTAASGVFTWSSSTSYFNNAVVGGTAPLLPAGVPVVIGRMFVKVSSGTFIPSAPLNFLWNVSSTGAGVVMYVNNATTTTGFQNNSTGTSKNNATSPTNGHLLNVPSNTCPTAAGASGTVDPTCFGGTGSTDITLTPAPLPLGGNYTVDGGAAVAFTTNPFTVSGLSQGTHTIAVTNTACTEVSTTVTIGGPMAAPTTVDNITECNSYVWAAPNGDGGTYSMSGTYTYANPSIGGCPGVSTLNLVINMPDNHVDNITECDTYTWTSGNNATYTMGGTYTYATSLNGCPGVATLNLVINTGTNPTTTASECTSYLWAENSTNYFATGVYTAATNANGCPGVATLNLTITGGHMVLATANNAASTVGSVTATGTLANNSVNFDVVCDYAAMIADGPSGVGAGATSVTVDVAASNYVGSFATNGQVYAPRKFTVSATNDESGNVTLYATQDDFDDYNANNGSLFDMNAASVKIAHVVGGLSGTVTPIATTATWNVGLNRYEISGDVSALNGEYYLYTDPECALNMGPISVGVQTLTSTQLTWAAVPGAINYEIRYRVMGATTWQNTTTTALAKVISTGLYSTTYEFQGKVRCSSTTSGLWGAVGTFTTLASPCQPAANLAATMITPSSATITWSAVPNVSSYVLQYRVINLTTPNTPIGVGSNFGTSRVLTGLLSATDYEVRTLTSCVGGALSAWSPWVPFTTLANPCTASAPMNIAAVATATTASVTWTPGVNATGYLFRYGLSASGPWNNAGGAAASRFLTGLTSNTQYFVEVQALCGATSTMSAWSTYNFTTGVSLRPSTEPASLTEATEGFNVYPNPTTDVINVELTAYQAQTTTVKVYDLTGRLIKQVVSQTEAGSQKIEVSLGEIASGVYTVQVYENDKMTHITRVRKN